MSSRPGQTVRSFRTLALLAIVVWGAFAWWALSRVRSTGDSLRDSLRADWPADRGPALGTREKLVTTADALADGRFWVVGDALTPVAPPTDDQRVAAARFLADRPELRQRLLALARAARLAEADSQDVTALRDALARAYRGAVKSDESAIVRQLDLAEEMLDRASSGPVGAVGPVDEQAVARLVVAVEPAYRLSLDLMTEGGAAAEKVLVEAARSFADQRYGDAAAAVRLAGDLLGAQGAPAVAAEMPEWFVRLGEREIAGVQHEHATALVELAEAMTLSMTPSGTVASLTKKARRELDAGRSAAAARWAAVTLNTLGMSDAAIVAATGNGRETLEEPSDEEGLE